MKEKEMERRLTLVEREMGVLVEDVDRNKLDLRSQIDMLRIELASLKRFLAERYPDFGTAFQRLKSETMLEELPE